MALKKLILFIFIFLVLGFISFGQTTTGLKNIEAENIRIAAFYHFEAITDIEVRKTISEQVIPATIAYYQAALKIKRLEKPIKLSTSRIQNCTRVKLPKSIKQQWVKADLVVIVTGYFGDYRGIARANPCVYDDQTGRPIMGFLDYNLHYKPNSTTNAFSYYENLISTTLHEFGHVLGFTAKIYENFINPYSGKRLLNTTIKKEINGVMVTILTLDPLTSRLREYFACPTLEGAYLEQEGFSISHFERRVFMNEIMASTVSASESMSEFYLAFLEGTGWYLPDYSMSDPMFWGKGKGCDFLNTKCINSDGTTQFPDHFCTNMDQWTCTYDKQSYGSCGTSAFYKQFTPLQKGAEFDYLGDGSVLSVDPYSDNCPYIFSDGQTECKNSRNQEFAVRGGQYFGPGSACFTGTLNKAWIDAPSCLKFSCQKLDSSQYLLTVEIEDEIVTCHQEGIAHLSDAERYVDCPDPFTFCEMENARACRRGCMGRGTCVNNQCVCQTGYYGSDCSYREVNETQVEGAIIIDESYYEFGFEFEWRWTDIVGIAAIIITGLRFIITNKTRKTSQEIDAKDKQNLASSEDSAFDQQLIQENQN